MPPKKKFSEEQVVDAAFSVAEEEGIDSITIRKVADRLNSSIAPIYVNFTDVEELKRAVVNKIILLSHQMIGEQHTGSPFGDVGAASLQFAKQYPVLIRDMIMKPNDYLQDYDQEMGAELVGYMKQDPELEGFTDEELMIILLKMRAFQLGLTMMAANGLLSAEFDLQRMKEMLFSVAEDVVIAARIRRQKDSTEVM